MYCSNVYGCHCRVMLNGVCTSSCVERACRGWWWWTPRQPPAGVLPVPERRTGELWAASPERLARVSSQSMHVIAWWAAYTLHVSGDVRIPSAAFLVTQASLTPGRSWGTCTQYTHTTVERKAWNSAAVCWKWGGNYLVRVKHLFSCQIIEVDLVQLCVGTNYTATSSLPGFLWSYSSEGCLSKTTPCLQAWGVGKHSSSDKHTRKRKPTLWSKSLHLQKFIFFGPSSVDILV